MKIKISTKEITVKFNYVFLNICSLVIVSSTEGYQIMYYFSRLNRLVSCHFIISRAYIRKTSWEQDQIKDRHDSIDSMNQQA